VAAALTATIAAMTVALLATPEIHGTALAVLREEGPEGPLAGDGEDDEALVLIWFYGFTPPENFESDSELVQQLVRRTVAALVGHCCCYHSNRDNLVENRRATRVALL
jgi:hypothetical protein